MSSPSAAQIAAALHIDDNTDMLEVITRLEHYLAFNRTLGLEVGQLTAERATFHLESRPELIGNAQKQALHGGVISATLDAAGGMVAMVALVQRAETAEAALRALMKVGTIDLRVDYLRPATAKAFTAAAYPLRIGRTVAVTRMEFHDDHGRLVAVGTGTYIVG
jgi:uncharacterized protein (TIGR00369 family)